MATTKPPAGQEAKAAQGYIGDKDRYLARLKRIEGQARGIHRMVDEDTYCIDILTQISALTSALENAAGFGEIGQLVLLQCLVANLEGQ